MEYIDATACDAEEITTLVQNTIRTVYPKYYPQKVVDFFIELHSKDNILKDIESGSVGCVKKDGKIIGTGCFIENHITRVYVIPDYQKQGYGTFIMNTLEEKIKKNYNCITLDASLPACFMYEKRGYKTVHHEKYDLDKGVVLVYEIMQKEFLLLNTNT